jgi:ankyrin repeat protein
LEDKVESEKLLLRAVRYGSTEATKLLVDIGAKIEARDSEERTPLYLAVFSRHCETAELLADLGANREAEHGGGYTLLLKDAAELLISI